MLLPHPLISLALFLLWLLLNQTIAPGPALVGLVVAVLGGLMLTRLRPAKLRMGAPLVALRLAMIVTVDILRSNVAVVQVILGRQKQRQTGFIHIPLTTRDPRALAALAVILTATPGTAWVEYDDEEGWLLLHILDLVDEEEWVRIVKDRYERPLMEIFR
jgi:multicomponent K+:H+ antiporter subunit E